MRDRLVKGRCGGAKVQLLKFIHDSTRKQTHVGSWLQGKALSLARKKNKANQHKTTVCPSIHMFHRIYWIITEERSPFQDQHFCSIFLGLGKVVTPLEKTRRTPNHPHMAHKSDEYPEWSNPKSFVLPYFFSQIAVYYFLHYHFNLLISLLFAWSYLNNQNYRAVRCFLILTRSC